MHINPFIESKVALENDCKNKKITIVLVYMSFFSGETPCSATGAGTGAKRGRPHVDPKGRAMKTPKRKMQLCLRSHAVPNHARVPWPRTIHGAGEPAGHRTRILYRHQLYYTLPHLTIFTRTIFTLARHFCIIFQTRSSLIVCTRCMRAMFILKDVHARHERIQWHTSGI